MTEIQNLKLFYTSFSAPPEKVSVSVIDYCELEFIFNLVLVVWDLKKL